MWNKHLWEFYSKKGLQNSWRQNWKLGVVVLRNRKKNYVAWGAYHFIAFRIIVASLYQKYFCGMTSPTLETALLSARCIYWLLFRKKSPSKVCAHVSTATLTDQNHSVCKCWYFSLRTFLRLRWKIDVEVWRSSGDSRDRCLRVIKRPPLLIFIFLFVTWDSLSLPRQETLPFIQSRTSPNV